jgi:GDP-4-dehydro-6-deoxy-D-mannose reductase
MRALITGISGFAGSFLAEYCLDRPGVDVIGLVRSRARLSHASPLASRIALMEADLRDAAAVDRAIATARPDAVFHLAAQAFVPQAFADPVGTFLDNAVGQLHVILAMLRHCPGTRLLVVGSAAEYGMVRPEENPVREDALLRPADPYAVSKVTQDLQGYQYFVSHNLQAVRVRPFNHTGPRQGEVFVVSRFAREIACIEAGLSPPELTVGNLTPVREFTDVRDVVRAYFLAGTEGEPGEVYNVGSGDGRQIQEVLDVLAGLSRARFTVRQDPALLRPVDVPALVCDGTKLHQQCGWEPQIPLERTLGDLLDYWRRTIPLEAEQRSARPASRR